MIRLAGCTLRLDNGLTVCVRWFIMILSLVSGALILYGLVEFSVIWHYGFDYSDYWYVRCSYCCALSCVVDSP